MDIPTIAFVAMVSAGVVLIVGGVVKLFKPGLLWWHLVVPFVFGAMLLGVSAFGLPFLTAYGEFLKDVLPLINSPGSGTYAKAIEAIGAGALSAENEEAAKAVMLSNPTADLEHLIEQRIPATKGDGKQRLEGLLGDLRARKQMAGQVTDNLVGENRVNAQTLNALDASTRAFVAQEIERRPQVIQHLPPTDRERVSEIARVRSAARR